MNAAENSDGAVQPPQIDNLPIAVRAYVEIKKVPSSAKTAKGRKAGPSDWTLIFDTETTTDPSQALRFGVYQVRKVGHLHERGVFIEPDILSPDEKALIRDYADEHRLVLHTRESFVWQIFYRYGFDRRGEIVGFNLPFDLSRLAIRHGNARRSAKGGFSFQLVTSPRLPRVQVRHLSARAAFIQFSAASGQRDNRLQRQKGNRLPVRRGFFVDVKTLSAALTSQSFSLARLADHLGTEHRKIDTEEHGQSLSATYLDYAMQDVQVTWECFDKLAERYRSHHLESTPRHRLYSEASLGKAYLKQMNIRPWREVQPEFPPQMLGSILSAYYGGRSEVRLRRIVRQVLYCDFLSMYPTVCTLMGLWRFVIATGMRHRDVTEEIRGLVASVSLIELRQPEFWPLLATLVQVQPDGEIFPIRAKYDARQLTIGLNHLSSERPVWYTLADVIAAKLLSGRTPQITQAIRFSADEPQGNLKPIDILGLRECRVGPYRDDFFRTAINLRTSVKRQRDDATDDEWAQLDAAQQTLKILANATSYGIFVELNVEDLDKSAAAACYGPDGEGFSIKTGKVESLGTYFHPLLATLITGAARLLLSITENLITQQGLDWAICDTDSMAIARPEGMTDAEFFGNAHAIVDWFEQLNPYQAKGSLLKIEDVNYAVGAADRTLTPLYCFAVSAKRYALFNLDPDGRPVIRKASAHGLGHLLAPYREDDAPQSIPTPTVALQNIGVERWQYDLWYRIILAAIGGHPDQVDLSDLSGFDRPAASRYHATTPNILNWFKKANDGKIYLRQLKPFNFLIAFSYLGGPSGALSEKVVIDPQKGRPKSRPKHLQPIAPYDSDIEQAARNARDRDTDIPVPLDELQTYRQALAQYHLHPESKFLNGDFVDRGPTIRRQVRATSFHHIGKEANRWEEQFFLGSDSDAQVEYGIAPDDQKRQLANLRIAADAWGQRALARAAGVSLRQVSAILMGRSIPRCVTAQKLARAMTELGQSKAGVTSDSDDIATALPSGERPALSQSHGNTERNQ